MQNTRAKIPALLIVITAVAACILRFFQLTQEGSSYTHIAGLALPVYSVYPLLFLGLAFCVIYASLKKNLAATFDFEHAGNSVYLSSWLLALTFFYDFIHQGYNCYQYISDTSYMDYTYLVPLCITCIFALFSCFYFITVAVSVKNTNYDFRNFTLLHFIPIVWAFTKLFSIMLQIVDIGENVDIACEFILLCTILCFLLSMVSAVDKKDAPATRMFVFSCAFLGFMSFTVGVPRIAAILTGAVAADQATYSAVTYIMLGVFSLCLLNDVNKRSKLNLKGNM